MLYDSSDGEGNAFPSNAEPTMTNPTPLPTAEQLSGVSFMSLLFHVVIPALYNGEKSGSSRNGASAQTCDFNYDIERDTLVLACYPDATPEAPCIWAVSIPDFAQSIGQGTMGLCTIRGIAAPNGPNPSNAIMPDGVDENGYMGFRNRRK